MRAMGRDRVLALLAERDDYERALREINDMPILPSARIKVVADMKHIARKALDEPGGS